MTSRSLPDNGANLQWRQFRGQSNIGSLTLDEEDSQAREEKQSPRSQRFEQLTDLASTFLN